jgi:hypothetical protein
VSASNVTRRRIALPARATSTRGIAVGAPKPPKTCPSVTRIPHCRADGFSPGSMQDVAGAAAQISTWSSLTQVLAPVTKRSSFTSMNSSPADANTTRIAESAAVPFAPCTVNPRSPRRAPRTAPRPVVFQPPARNAGGRLTSGIRTAWDSTSAWSLSRSRTPASRGRLPSQ